MPRPAALPKHDITACSPLQPDSLSGLASLVAVFVSHGQGLPSPTFLLVLHHFHIALNFLTSPAALSLSAETNGGARQQNNVADPKKGNVTDWGYRLGLPYSKESF